MFICVISRIFKLSMFCYEKHGGINQWHVVMSKSQRIFFFFLSRTRTLSMCKVSPTSRISWGPSLTSSKWRTGCMWAQAAKRVLSYLRFSWLSERPSEQVRLSRGKHSSKCERYAWINPHHLHSDNRPVATGAFGGEAPQFFFLQILLCPEKIVLNIQYKQKSCSPKNIFYPPKP